MNLLAKKIKFLFLVEGIAIQLKILIVLISVKKSDYQLEKE